MDIKLFEEFLIDNIGMNKETRTKILEFVSKNTSKVETKIEEIKKDMPVADLKLFDQSAGNSLLEATLKHREGLVIKEEKAKEGVREAILNECGDITKRIGKAFEGMKK